MAYNVATGPTLRVPLPYFADASLCADKGPDDRRAEPNVTGSCRKSSKKDDIICCRRRLNSVFKGFPLQQVGELTSAPTTALVAHFVFDAPFLMRSASSMPDSHLTCCIEQSRTSVFPSSQSSSFKTAPQQFEQTQQLRCRAKVQKKNAALHVSPFV